MRNLLLVGLLAILPMVATAQSKHITQFFNQYKTHEEVSRVNLGGFVVRLMGNFVDDDDARKIIRKVSHLRVLSIDDPTIVSADAYTTLVKGIKSDRFEELIQMREGEQRIEFFLREKGERITDVLMLLRGKDEFLLLSLEGAFKFSDLKDLRIDIEGGEHFSKLPERKKKA